MQSFSNALVLNCRVTWVASEGLTNYFRRVIQDEKSREMQNCQSYSDFSSIPENELYGSTLDSKGRRLSYQRAVSGEDPVMPTRQYYDSTRRRHFIPENAEVSFSNNKQYYLLLAFRSVLRPRAPRLYSVIDSKISIIGGQGSPGCQLSLWNLFSGFGVKR